MGQKGGGTFSFNWKDWNFPFIPGKTTRAKYKGGYTRQNGIQKNLLESFLRFFFFFFYLFVHYISYNQTVHLSANIDIMAGDLSKLNELFYEDPLIATSEKSSVCPIISQCSLKVIPISYATDGMSLKPGLQFDSRLKELVRLVFPVDLAYVQARSPSPIPKC